MSDEVVHERANQLDVWMTQDKAGYFDKDLHELTVKLPCLCGHESVLRTDITKRELMAYETVHQHLDVLRESLVKLHDMHVSFEEREERLNKGETDV